MHSSSAHRPEREARLAPFGLVLGNEAGGGEKNDQADKKVTNTETSDAGKTPEETGNARAAELLRKTSGKQEKAEKDLAKVQKETAKVQTDVEAQRKQVAAERAKEGPESKQPDGAKKEPVKPEGGAKQDTSVAAKGKEAQKPEEDAKKKESSVEQNASRTA